MVKWYEKRAGGLGQSVLIWVMHPNFFQLCAQPASTFQLTFDSVDEDAYSFEEAQPLQA